MEERGGQGTRVADFAFLPLCSALSLFFGWSCGPAAEEAVVALAALAAVAAAEPARAVAELVSGEGGERERERQALGRPAACGRRQEPGRRGAEARRGQAGEEGPDPRVDLSSASRRARLLASRTPRLAHSLARKETGIRRPAGEPGAWWPICGAASLLGLHPATGDARVRSPRVKLQMAWQPEPVLYLLPSSPPSQQTMKARSTWADIMQTLRDHRCQPRLLYPAKLSINNDGENKLFHDLTKIKQYN
ncbi:uncharacterized protein LOC129681009 [Psammomys obesus]|uniref:uncharacterized protein LOC129681009 n=1 Tax=Psammomys obesus TaxID=48139 RepID=UPI002452B562|nr:uncharacterized protein LOC129681009 [Psammomys obesus]